MSLFGSIGHLFSANKAPSGPPKLAAFMQAKQQMQMALAQKQMRQQLADIQSGYGAAIGNASLGAGQAKQDVQDLLKQSLGSDAQMGINSGLYGSSAGAAQSRGSYADAMRAMNSVNAQLAGNMQNLQMARANAMAGARTNLANFYQQRSGAETSMNQNFWNAMPKSAAPNPIFGALGGLAGSFLGPFGAVAGSSLANSWFGGGNSGGGGMDSGILH